MNERANSIVSELLDLTEDLMSKMQLLLKQFPDYTEEQIQKIAEADPTSPARADYVTWLLRLHKKKLWDGSVEPVHDMLTRYNGIKRAADFVGQRDINQIKSVDELGQVLRANEQAGSHAQKAKKGAEKIAQKDDLALFRLTTPEACRKFAIGQGSTDQPEARWCTIAIDTAAGYLKNYGNVYTVLKDGHSYVQVEFRSNQAKTAQNQDISQGIAAEIAPLFNIPEFDEQWNKFKYKAAGWTVTDEHVVRQLQRLIKRWFSEQISGYSHPSTGAWVKPLAKSAREARNTLLEHMPKFFELFVSAIQEGDESILRQIGERRGGSNGLQVLYNEVYKLKHEMPVKLPPILQSYKTFEKTFHQLADEVTRSTYASLEPAAEKQPAPEAPQAPEASLEPPPAGA